MSQTGRRLSHRLPRGRAEDEVPLPRVVMDLNRARPNPSVADRRIQTVEGSEGPWNQDLTPKSPGILIGGKNPVATDASRWQRWVRPGADYPDAPFLRADNPPEYCRQRSGWVPTAWRILISWVPGWRMYRCISCQPFKAACHTRAVWVGWARALPRNKFPEKGRQPCFIRVTAEDINRSCGYQEKSLVYGDKSLLSEFRMDQGAQLPWHAHPP